MKRNFQKLLLPLIIAPFLFAIPLESSQQSFVNSPASTIEITKTGLEISKSLLEQNDIDGAKYAAKFASEHFALDLINLREYDSDLTDEIHIKLLDLYPSVKSDSIDNSLETIDETISELDDYEITEDNSDLIVVDLLTVADEQYTIAITDENESAYLISKSLFQKSKQLFEENADLTVMLDLEQQSFFNDIEKAVKNKESFLTVGTIVSAIQRDLLGTETLVHDQSVLYEKIRTLYSQMLESLDAGDYKKAEELAIEAYLENFEYLEPALEIVDAEFMYALEIDMREELRAMIVNEQDPTIIRTFVEKSIIPDLNEGESKVMTYLEENPHGFVNTDRELKDRGESTDEQQSEVRSEIDFIRSSLEEMMVHYENADYQSAYATARTAYLDSYEYVEIPLRPIAPDFTLEVEYQFAELRNLIKERAPVNEVREVSTNINRNLDESERLVTGTGAVAPWIAFTASFSIIFREGLEAVLILGAILTYLEASRNNKFKPYIHYGVIIAIGATAVTWFIASYIIEISGANRELIEAIAALSATAVLFYVSFWILNKIEHKKWMEFVKAKVWQATTTGSVMVFVMLAFFTVYREGFETVLFYQAMFGFAKYMEIYVGLGFVLGLGALFALYFVMRKLGKRLPLRVLFGMTMGVGAYLSIAFLGNAIREFQILDVLPYTSLIGTVPRLDINMATMTGIYPTLETIIGQIILLSVYMTASVYILVLRPRREKQIAMMRKSRRTVDG